MFGCVIRRFYGRLAANKVKITDVLYKKSSLKQALVKGWIRSVRKHKYAVFLDVNDGSTMQCLQVVIDPVNFKSGISYGASVCVTGDIVETKKHRGGIEMQCCEIELIGSCTEEFAFNKHADHYPQYLRSYPHLRPKEESMMAVLRTRNALEMEIHNYFQLKNFLHVHTPILTSSDCEGAGETFSVTTDVVSVEPTEDHKTPENLSKFSEASDNSSEVVTEDKSNFNTFFGVPSFLTVSGQLHLEACAVGVGNVYTLNPAFRAEKSESKKHLSEFRMLEVEVAFTQSLEELMDLMEDSIQSTMQAVSERCSSEMEIFYKDEYKDHRELVDKVANNKYIRLPYREVLEIMSRYKNHMKTFLPTWGDDLNNEHEHLLMEHTNNCPVFITDFPQTSKPFYMYENPDGETVSAVDLIFPFCGELCGGSVREHRLDLLQERLRHLEMLGRYDWYLDLRRHGNVPHAGYGMGFDRLVRFLLGINNIRDAVPFPRAPRSCVL